MRIGLSILLLVVVGCTGRVNLPGFKSSGGGDGSGAGAGGGGVEAPCVPEGPLAVSPMVRVSRAQMDNLTHDLLQTTVVPSASLLADEKQGPFAVNAVTVMTVDLASAYQFVAEAIGDEVEANVQQFVACTDTSTAGGHSCADKWILQFGPRAFRRPLTDDEHGRWLALYDTEAAAANYAGGIRAVVEGMLQSPNFLYRVEQLPAGVDPSTTTPWKLDQYALATRLSFLIWNSGPDDVLIAKAKAGELTNDALPAEVDRMLNDPRRKNASLAFTEAWAGIDTLILAATSPARLGTLDASLIPMMHDETVALVDDTLRTDGRLQTLFTTTQSAAPAALASTVYEITSAPDPSGHVTLNANRSGILSNASVMFTHAHSEQTSPVLRGRWLRENILCQPIPDPPPTVIAVPDPPKPGQTTRQRFEQHRTDPSCASCHALLDDVGFGFEAFDQYGKHRDTDENLPIDDSGHIIGTDIDGDFKGVVELGQKLSTSALAQNCFSRQWYRFGLGHDTSMADTCTMKAMSTAMTQPDGFRQALHLLVQTDAFTQRRSP